MVTKEQWAYIACAVDGEGTIGFHKVKAGKHGRKSDGFLPRVAVTNTNYAFLEWIGTQLGGHPHLAHKATETRKACYVWEVRCGPRVTAILKNLLPYLIIKKQQAIVMLEYCDRRSRRYRNLERDSKGRMKTWELSQEELQLVQEIYQLNKRGSQPGPNSHAPNAVSIMPHT
jgi:hypothetical protein